MYLLIVGGVGGRSLEKLRSLAASGADGLSESTLCCSAGYTVVGELCIHLVGRRKRRERGGGGGRVGREREQDGWLSAMYNSGGNH